MNSSLESITKLFEYYKSLGEKSIAQLSDDQLLWRPNEQTNSISLLVHHMSGNMISRFTDFQTTDGEKPWRNREAEFEVAFQSRKEMIAAWEKGWNVLFDALAPLKPDDLQKII